jgi:hypothetical protein
MILGIVIGFCVLLLVVAFLAPRMSRHLERGGHAPMRAGQRAGHKAPGGLGRLLAKPFQSASKAISRSGSAGRRGRGRLPL